MEKKKDNFKPCLTKQLVNVSKLWCECEYDVTVRTRRSSVIRCHDDYSVLQSYKPFLRSTLFHSHVEGCCSQGIPFCVLREVQSFPAAILY